MTKHREEYEDQMLGQLGEFDLLINGTIERSDQAFFSNSFALQAAIDGRQAVIRNPVTGTRTAISQSDANTMATSVMNILPAPTVTTDTTKAQAPTIFANAPNGLTLSNFGGNITSTSIALEPTLALDQRSRYIQHLHELRRINEGDDTADSPGYALNLVRIPVSVLPGRATREGYGAEVTVTMTPYLSDSLLPTTFRSLVMNDVVRQLALPMTRLVEIRSWERDKKKADAEKHARASVEVLAMEKRGIENQIAEVDERIKQYDAARDILDRARKTTTAVRFAPNSRLKTTLGMQESDLASLQEYKNRIEKDPAQASIMPELNRSLEIAEISSLAKPISADLRAAIPQLESYLPRNATFADVEQLRVKLDAETRNFQNKLKAVQEQITAREQVAQNEVAAITSNFDREIERSATPALPISRTRRALTPLPASQILRIYTREQLESVAKRLDLNYQGRNIRWADDCPDPAKQSKPCADVTLRVQGRVLTSDAESFLQAELEAAYELYARIPQEKLLQVVSECRLAERIRIGDFENVCLIREHLITEVLDKLSPECSEKCPPLKKPKSTLIDPMGENGLISVEALPVPTEINLASLPVPPCNEQDPDQRNALHALVWAIVVEGALLNEHLTNDIRSTANAKGCPCGNGGQAGHFFYLPQPLAEDCQAFNDYVRCRWPIHVFALDPVTQDQNLADAFGRRRELQLAASLAFVSGRISAANLSRFVRRLEADYETVALNRTVVGFSHGDDTFGWRFAPRFQTPPPASGVLCAFGETLFGGPSPDCELLHRRIEPGMRECVAIVIMPSFVPYATMDVRSNWYRLNHHHGWLPTRHNTEQSMTDVMKLSRAIQSMHHTAAAIGDAGQYRTGEVERLLRRVQQLDRELPLQSMQVQIPIENTLGGFAMFNNGITDLAPELDGWHGGPGVNPNGDTTLFLVGDHFSVHHTLVIAGDKQVTDVTMLSRQILQVKIPGGVKTNYVDGDEYVDVHVATPYGVTSHLHIPVDRRESESFQAKLIWSPDAVTADYKITAPVAPATTSTIEITGFDRTAMTLQLPAAATQLPAAKVTLSLSLYANGNEFLGNTAALTDVLFDPKAGAYTITGPQFTTLTDGMKTLLDGYLTFLLQHSSTGGATLGEIPIEIVGKAESSDASVSLSTLRLTLKKTN